MRCIAGRAEVCDDRSNEAASLRLINVVLNWFEELKWKVPSGKN
jgi:hypothetical protein